MTRPAISPVDVMALANAGRSAAEAAELLGCDSSWIYKMSKDLGVTFPRRPDPRRTDNHVRAEVARLRAKGLTYEQIAAEVGRSKSWVAMFFRGER